MARFALDPEGTTHVYRGGVVAGTEAGLFVLALGILGAALKRQNLWPVFKGASAPFFGQRAMAPGFDLGPFVMGVVGHFAICLVAGVAFAAVFYGLSKRATVAAGALWGIVVWLVLFYVVLPVVGLGAMARGVPVLMAVIQHVLFGVVIAVAFLPFQRRVPKRWPGGRRQPVRA